MRKYFLMILLVLCSCLQADENFMALWMTSLESYEHDEPEKALEQITSAISIMSEEEIEKYPDIFADRCFMKNFLFEDENLIEESTDALTKENLSHEGKTKCMLSKIGFYSRKQMTEECMKELDIFGEHVNAPKYEFSKDYIVITDVPTTRARRDFTTCLMIHTGLAENKSKIHFYDKKCIVERNQHSPCGCKECESIYCDNCMRTFYMTATPETIQGCKNWCDRVATFSATQCGRRFIPFTCQVACAVVINELRVLCNKCCDTGDFMNNCVKPFETFVQQVPCHPDFDR